MKPLLAIHHMSLNIPGVEKAILSDISYEVTQGDFIIILGSNGSGKSSLMKCIDGRYHPTHGKITLQKNISIATITQQSNESLFPSLTLLEHFLLIKKNHESAEFFAKHLAAFNDNLPAKLHQTVDQLSGGEKQALILALTFLYPPNILLLDEHTSALDPKSAEKLMEITHSMIIKHHITCLMTTHDLDIAHRYGNRVLALGKGKVIQTIDSAEKLALKQNDLLAACY